MTAAGDPARERRFEEIEGLRGWLSWTVVVWHIVQYTALNAHVRWLGSTAGLAHVAVELFIVVSGFVVTHLIVTRRERYAPYLVRRAFRLFPVYLVALAAGAATTGLAAIAVTAVPWHGDPGFAYRDVLLQTYASQRQWLGWHSLLHLTMLHGLVPDSVLPYASAVFLGPAWSLSLEWQFYLIAPLLVLGLRRRPLPVGLLMIALYAAAQVGLFGEYRLMSDFPAVAHLFLLGIVTRLLFARLAAIRFSPLAVAVAGLALVVVAPVFAAVGLWLGFAAFLIASGRPLGGPDRPVARLWHMVFSSGGARWLGARSYPVYLVHWPVVQLAMFGMAAWFSADQRIAALQLAAIVLPVTLIVAELVHLLVERPMIRLGARLVGRAASPSPRLASAS